mgnify:CR=1 FL=1
MIGLNFSENRAVALIFLFFHLKILFSGHSLYSMQMYLVCACG